MFVVLFSFSGFCFAVFNFVKRPALLWSTFPFGRVLHGYLNDLGNFGPFFAFCMHVVSLFGGINSQFFGLLIGRLVTLIARCRRFG